MNGPSRPIRPNPFCRLLCLSLLAPFLLTQLVAASAEEQPRPPAWGLELDAGWVKQFETSIDSGGDFDIHRFLVQVSAKRRIGEKGSAGLSLSYGESRYHFSGDTGFAGLDPWGTVREVRIGIPLRYHHNDTWSFYGIPSVRYRAESGASLSDSDEWGMLAGASYRFSDRLRIGPGIGVFTDMEDSGVDLSPFLVIDWKITDTLSLTTGRDLAASRGPGLALKWTPIERWTFRLSGRREKVSFRLDTDGPAPDGLGRDKSIPLSLSATYKPAKGIRLHLLAGVDFAGNLRLEDSDGDRVADSDYDPAPFAGLLITLRPSR